VDACKDSDFEILTNNVHITWENIVATKDTVVSAMCGRHLDLGPRPSRRFRVLAKHDDTRYIYTFDHRRFPIPTVSRTRPFVPYRQRVWAAAAGVQCLWCY